jgi:heme exporter protein A
MNNQPLIQVKNLVKRFGPLTVLRELDFEVFSGEFVALLGPNGSGKTTLLRILGTLSRPTSGMVRIASYQLPQAGASLRAHLGVVSHQPLLYGDLTAEENLQFFSKLYAVEGERIREVLDLVGLANRKNDLVRTFSRGMQQRLTIGRAILHNPRILLLDEPHTGLDQEAGEILDNVLQTVALEGRTVLMTSHDLVRAASLATRVDLLSRGKIAASSPTADMDSSELVGFYRTGLGQGAGS